MDRILNETIRSHNRYIKYMLCVLAPLAKMGPLSRERKHQSKCAMTFCLQLIIIKNNEITGFFNVQYVSN